MPTDSKRPRRVAEVLRRQLVSVIQYEMAKPLPAHVTLTAVEVAHDLKSAKVFITCMDDHGAAQAHTSPLAKTALAELNHAEGFLRHALRDRVQLRTIPRLRFIYDESIAQGQRVEQLLQQIRQEPAPEPAAEGDKLGQKKT